MSATSEPDAYRIGWVPFFETTIFLDSHPLIPRTETEYWTEKAVLDMQHRDGVIKVLDLFSGSGCVGVAVLKHVPNAHVDFAEIEEKHLPTIQKNIDANITDSKRARVIHSDVWSAVADTYDFVLANPPYLSKSRVNRIQSSVLEHEPEGALFAGNEGFSLIERTLTGLPQHLSKDGALYIEHEPEHEAMLTNVCEEYNLRVETFLDQYGIKRYSKIRIHT